MRTQQAPVGDYQPTSSRIASTWLFRVGCRRHLCLEAQMRMIDEVEQRWRHQGPMSGWKDKLMRPRKPPEAGESIPGVLQAENHRNAA